MMTKAELREKFKDTSRYLRFMEDMQDSGYTVNVYTARGMNGVECPSVTCERDELQNVIRATNLPICHETLGKGYVVYVR